MRDLSIRPIRRGPADEAMDMWRGPGWILSRTDADKLGLLCPYRVGKRVCVAGPKGHAGPHDWPKER